MKVQFCNSKSVELFGIDLKKVRSYELDEIKFTPHINSVSELGNDNYMNQISLKQILTVRTEANQTYTIKSETNPDLTKIVILKCINMVFNNIECHVLNFADMTSFLDLER